MGTQRIEAFSDGVIAVIITITVFNLNLPADDSLKALLKLTPFFLAYALSFTVVAIFWVNHHHVLHLAKHPSAKVMWANNFLLFWMCLIPFTTSYLGRNHGSPLSVAVYGAVLALCGLAFTILRYVVNQFHLHDAQVAGHNRRVLYKAFFTSMLYASTIPLAYLSVRISYGIFVLIPAAYFLPEGKLID